VKKLARIIYDGSHKVGEELARTLIEAAEKSVGSHQPMAVRIAPTRAQFARFLGECLKPETRWRSEVNSNCRYRFLNCQTTALC
jgi:hypothetical protein